MVGNAMGDVSKDGNADLEDEEGTGSRVLDLKRVDTARGYASK